MATFITTCALCGAHYEAQRSTSRYCSNAHRAEAGRAATLDALRAAASRLLLDQTVAILDRGIAIANGDIELLRSADRRLVEIDERTTALFEPRGRRVARGA